MRKIYILLLIVFVLLLSGCFKNNVNSTVYISSIGFDVEDEKIVGFFLSNPMTNISRGDNSGEPAKPEYVKVESTSVFNLFEEAKKSLLSPLNYRHIKTVIFQENCFGSKYIEEFFNFMKSVLYISYNYYVFATKDKIEDVFNFKNPEQISYQYSILSSPNLLKFEEFGTEKLHFLDYANDFYEDGRYLHIPLLKVNKTWNEHVTIEVNGFISIKESCKTYENDKFHGMFFLYDKDVISLEDKDSIYRVIDYNVNYINKNGVFTCLISYKELFIFGGGSASEFENRLEEEIKKFFNAYIEEHNKLYLITQYNYLNKKALDVLKYNIEIIT